VVEPKVIDLNAVVAETGDMLRRLIQPGIELQVAPAPHPLTIRADPSQVQQVVMNLCLNARDAIAGTGTIEIRTEPACLTEQDVRLLPGLSPGDFARVRVSDSGVGMDAHTQERAFEPFFTTKPRGTGLGLPTVYGIVKQSGGYVAVESAPGSGTTVSVSFPSVHEPLALRSVSAEVPAKRGTSTILIVDDELSVREVVERFLESLGYRVLTASDGRDALNVFEKQRDEVDAVVTDILMPGMSGLDLARELERVCPSLPVLFISGYPQQEGTEALASRPHSAFLPKPFSLQQIAKTLEVLLASESPRVRRPARC
jgi:CheY-like chemotaxis protein